MPTFILSKFIKKNSKPTLIGIGKVVDYLGGGGGGGIFLYYNIRIKRIYTCNLSCSGFVIAMLLFIIRTY